MSEGHGSHPKELLMVKLEHLDCILFKKNFFLTFIYFLETKRQSMSRGGAEREGATESEAGSELAAQSLTLGSNSQTTRS